MIHFHSRANRATYTGRTAGAEWREWISGLVQIRGRTVADVGCGGGIYARALVELGAAHVFAVDFSTAMLEGAREYCAGIEAISFHHGTATATGLDDAICDLALERALIHHIDTYTRNFSEIRRILRPGGLLMVQDRTMQDVLQPPSAEHIRGYFFELFPRLYEVEAARRPDAEKVRHALETSGFCRIRSQSLWETRQVYTDMTALGDDVLKRKGRSILHALTDDELQRLIRYLQPRMPAGPLVEKDRWTLWVAENPTGEKGLSMSRHQGKLEAMTETEENVPSLTILHDGTPIFTSFGKWLHPLFELEPFLAEHAVPSKNLVLQDKIIGKAAALMIQRLGFRTVKAGVLSRPGEAVLHRYGIAYTYEQLVHRIHCQTEELLADVEDPEEAFRLVRARAGR